MAHGAAAAPHAGNAAQRNETAPLRVDATSVFYYIWYKVTAVGSLVQ